MLLSDRDILAEIEAKRIVVEPYDEAMIQPSSIDFRLDRYFRVFENHRYPHIDPAADQSDLTRQVEPVGEELVAFEEGCLSVVGYEAVVARPLRVRLRGQDETGRALDEELGGWPARIVQHETDHLSGTLYLDRADLRTLASTGRVS